MDDVERAIRAFGTTSGESASAWKLDRILDLGQLTDARIVPFFLAVLADQEESVPVRVEVLKRLRNGRLGPEERPRVAHVIMQVLAEPANPELRPRCALAL